MPSIRVKLTRNLSRYEDGRIVWIPAGTIGTVDSFSIIPGRHQPSEPEMLSAVIVDFDSVATTHEAYDGPTPDQTRSGKWGANISIGPYAIDVPPQDLVFVAVTE